MENIGGKFRKKKIGFTQVGNHIIRNKEVSLKAKGLYALIQSYITLETFDVSKGFLMSMCKEGERAFNSSWRELRDAGYLKMYRMPSKINKGKFEYEYDLLDEPDLETASLINLKSDGSFSSDSSEETLKNTQIDHHPQKGEGGETPLPTKCTKCATYPIQKGGSKSNTDFNNTVVVVISNKKIEIKDTFRKIQLDKTKDIYEKLSALKKIKCMNNHIEALMYKLLEANILVSETQMKMLEGCDYSVAALAIDKTIAQGGESFSYFYEVYLAKEKEDIEKTTQDFIFDNMVEPKFIPKFRPSFEDEE